MQILITYLSLCITNNVGKTLVEVAPSRVPYAIALVNCAEHLRCPTLIEYAMAPALRHYLSLADRK